jgi:hypothetical protein
MGALRDGKPAFVKQLELFFYDDKDAKPIAIQTSSVAGRLST